MIIRMHWDGIIRGEMKYNTNEKGASAMIDCGKGTRKARYSIVDCSDGSLEIRAVQWGKCSSPRIVVRPDISNMIRVRGERLEC